MNRTVNSRLLTRECCAKLTGIVVISATQSSLAQAPVVTLGIPKANRPAAVSVFEPSRSAQEPSIAMRSETALPLTAVRIEVRQQPTVDGDDRTIEDLFQSFRSSAQESRFPSRLPSPEFSHHCTEETGVLRRDEGLPELPQPKPQISDTYTPRGSALEQPRQSSTADSRPANIPSDPFPGDIAPARTLTEIRRAAMRQRSMDTDQVPQITPLSEPVQTGYSIQSLRKSAIELISDAQLKLEIRAYLSAEEKAKKALELIAQSIDVREQSALATRDLIVAFTAIREAEDFAGKYGLVDGVMITRMVRSHSTEILKPYDSSKLNGLAAADIYLDWARRCLTPLTLADPLAADAIRIISQSYQLRDGGTQFGIAAAVHLIRAAASAAPDNDQVQSDLERTLQVAGLSGQSEHNSRDVQVIEVSPAQFAAISPVTAGPTGGAGGANIHTVPVTREAAYQTPSPPEQGMDQSFKGRVSRALDPITRPWR